MLVHLITMNHLIDLKSGDQAGFIDNHAALLWFAPKRSLHGENLIIRLVHDFEDIAVATLTNLFNFLVYFHRVLLNDIYFLINVTHGLKNRS